MAEKQTLESCKHFLEALDSSTTSGKTISLHKRNPRARLLLILLKEGPLTVPELVERSEIVMSQFQIVYHDMIEKELVMGPVFSDEVQLTGVGEQLARLQEESL